MKGYNPPDALFLEPPHLHDPTDVSHVAALPESMLSQLPLSVQDALWTLQESTSIVYASYERLQELLDQRFDRLIPLPMGAGTSSRRCMSAQRTGVHATKLTCDRFRGGLFQLCQPPLC